jgi:KDO2-lipid IV(A) lauroyltransferase
VLARVIDGAAAVGCRLPARVAHTLAFVGGHLEWMARPRKRRVLATNLAHAVGEPPTSRAVRQLVRREVVNEARRSADLLWAIGRPHEMLESVRIDGLEHVKEAVSAGRGLVLASLHIGGWEVAGAVPAAVVPVPTTVVVADNWLAWAMRHVRSAEGLRVIYRTSSAIGAARLLRRGEALLVLGEDASGPPPRLHRVRFCDSYARLPAGIVSLARITGAVIVPFSVLPDAPRRWRVRIEPVIEPPPRDGTDEDEAAVLQQLADRWTTLLRSHAEYWAASFPIAWDEP